MQFSFEYYIDPKDHKSEEEIRQLQLRVLCGQSSNQMLCKTEEYHPNIKTLQLFWWIMPSHHLLYENVCKGQQINLRCTLKGCQPLKRYIYIYKCLKYFKRKVHHLNSAWEPDVIRVWAKLFC